MEEKLYCRVCNKELKKVCITCLGKIFNWKNICCCQECFQVYIEKEEERIEELKNKL
jgi:hypothetical protein